MIHFKIYKNMNTQVLILNRISVDYFKQIDLVRGVPWYIVDRNHKLIGRIGLKEHREIIQRNEIVLNKDFVCIVDDGNAQQKAAEIFMKKPEIKKIPIVSLDGRYLFEYEYREGQRGIEDYYKEYMGTCYKGSERKEKIVVSLTSYGERMSTVYMAINSILCQTMKPDEIVVYISAQDSRRDLINEENLIRAGVTIRRNVKDVGPHKKYLYAFQEYEDCLVITIDDDAIYDDRTIENLYDVHTKYPEAVICRRGRRMVLKNGELEPYQEWENFVVSTEPEMAVCAIGIGGILYPRGSYRRKALDEDTIVKIAIKQDDLWLKAIELKEDIKVYALGDEGTITIEGSQKNALNNINVQQRKNDECIQKIQKFFQINFCDYI